MSESLVSVQIPASMLPIFEEMMRTNKAAEEEKKILISSVFNTYIERYQILSRNTRLHYQQEFNNLIKWLAANHPECTTVGSLTPKIGEEFVRYDYATKKSARFEIATLRRIWREVVPSVKNPWEHRLHLVTHQTEKCQSHRPLTPRELNRVVTTINDRITTISSPEHKPLKNELSQEFLNEFKDALVFAHYYGMRVGSIASLKWSDFKNFAHRSSFLHLPPKTAHRNPKPLDLPYLEDVTDVLKRRKPTDIIKSYKEGERLFPLFSSRYDRSPSSISMIFRRFVKKAKIKDSELGIASFHSLRTTFVSRMDDVSAPVYLTDSITGHKTKGMHAVYSKPSPRAKRKWILKAISPFPKNAA